MSKINLFKIEFVHSDGRRTTLGVDLVDTVKRARKSAKDLEREGIKVDAVRLITPGGHVCEMTPEMMGA